MIKGKERFSCPCGAFMTDVYGRPITKKHNITYGKGRPKNKVKV
jgi:hypothetical protein